MSRCEFCGGRAVAWIHSAGGRDWEACAGCHAAIEADDREALLDRANLIPIPRTLPERYAPHFRHQARQLHDDFWQQRSGPSLAPLEAVGPPRDTARAMMSQENTEIARRRSRPRTSGLREKA